MLQQILGLSSLIVTYVPTAQGVEASRQLAVVHIHAFKHQDQIVINACLMYMYIYILCNMSCTTMYSGGVWGCVGVCGGVWGCVGVCGGVWGCVGVCGGVWGCVGVCGGVWGCVGGTYHKLINDRSIFFTTLSPQMAPQTDLPTLPSRVPADLTLSDRHGTSDSVLQAS